MPSPYTAPVDGPLLGRRFAVTGCGPAADEARELLALFSAADDAGPAVRADAPCDGRLWARSGAMELTGRPDGPPLAPSAPVASRLRGAAAVLAALSAALGREVLVDGPALLAERAALTGWRRAGDSSVGGACRLVPAADGFLALSLARPADVELVGAWLHLNQPPACTAQAWAAAAHVAGRKPAGELVARAVELGLPAAQKPPATPRPRPPLQARRVGAPREPGAATPVVLDLSALWAGPLCASLLGHAGATVVKVEAADRLDGARGGPPAFYDLLNGGHLSVVLDLHSPQGHEQLLRLVRSADVVVSAARPQALRALGLDPEAEVSASPGLTWVAVTAHGTSAQDARRVGFGDDCAVAGGLLLDDGDGPVFVADAAADPMTGLYGAVAALACLLGGGGYVVDLSLREVAGHVARGGSTVPRQARQLADGSWVLDTEDGPEPVRPPAARRARGRSASAGVDTSRLLASLAGRAR